MMANAQRPDYAESYTLSGCGNEPYCGVFTRVQAQCTAGSGDFCPGGAAANGNTDPTLCDGAPVYVKSPERRHGNSYLLVRDSYDGWIVVEIMDESDVDSVLNDCDAMGWGNEVGYSADKYPPVAPTLIFLYDNNPNTITVVAGGGR